METILFYIKFSYLIKLYDYFKQFNDLLYKVLFVNYNNNFINDNNQYKEFNKDLSYNKIRRNKYIIDK